MLSTCQDSGPGVTALVQILFLGHCIQVQKSVFLALYRARKITLSFSFPQTMWKLILVHLRGRKHFCIWVEKCFPPLRCTPTSVFYMVWGKKEYKVIFLALYNARKTTFCTWVWCLLSKWWVRKNIFPISYILQKVLRCRKSVLFMIMFCAEKPKREGALLFYADHIKSEGAQLNRSAPNIFSPFSKCDILYSQPRLDYQ